ncbi:MAG: M10 family metallopeptidase C-terminal domain-containing protein, partial [Pseudomonadota bacterium]
LNDIYGNDSYGGQDFGTENAFTGNTIYGFNTNITSAESDIWANFSSFANRTASTIIDGGGIDTLDVSGYSANQLIDLRVSDANDTAPTTMNIGGRTGNLTLAVGTVIENADGGSGNDTFYGNAAANSFRGNQGDDTFVDSAGGDSYRGGSGSDRVEFGSSFASYSFELAGDFLEVVDSAFSSVTDLVHDTIEFLDFTDQSLSFSSLVSGLSAPIPTATITAISDNRGSITGTIADGGATNDRSPTLSGTLDATLDTGQDLAVFRHGAKVGEASVNGTSWSFTDSGVQDGSRLYTVAVEDGGTTGQASAGYRITVDGTAPVVTVDAVSGEASAPALGGTLNDPTADVTVRVDGRTYDAQNDGDGTWSLAAGTLTGLAPGDYDVAVTATDAVGNAGTDATSGELTITAPAPAPAPVAPSAVVAFGEVTVEQPNAATWFTVTFAETIPDAVVVMGPVTANGGQPANARVRNVTDEGFEFQIEEWDYLDGYHITETVGWMAASAGSYTVGGLSVQAGTTTAVNETWQTVDIAPGFDESPVVMAQVASENDDAAVITRVRNVRDDSFELQMQEEEAADSVHASEEIHWIAVETGDGSAFDAGTTANAVTDADYDILYGSNVAADSIFLADMQTRDGGDTANLRVRDSDANGATVFVNEEKSRDDEVAHTSEVVGYVVAEDGYWYA